MLGLQCTMGGCERLQQQSRRSCAPAADASGSVHQCEAAAAAAVRLTSLRPPRNIFEGCRQMPFLHLIGGAWIRSTRCRLFCERGAADDGASVERVFG